MSIYNMKLHETYHENNGNIDITKVPNGWIYHYIFFKTSTFVPDNNEIHLVISHIVSISADLNNIANAVREQQW